MHVIPGKRRCRAMRASAVGESSMPLEQRQVEVMFLDGRQGIASATGNNASWQCACGNEQWLIGRSGAPAGPTDGTRVECPRPSCARNYFVVPEGPAAQTRVVRVEEIDWQEAD